MDGVFFKLQLHHRPHPHPLPPHMIIMFLNKNHVDEVK